MSAGFHAVLMGILSARPGGAPSFVPSDVSSYVASWTTDMDPASGTLTSWNDDGASGYDLDTIAGDPQVDVSLAGEDAPSFDGTGDRVRGSGSATLANVLGTGADGDYEIWAVTDLTASGDTSGWFYDTGALFTGSAGWMGLTVESSTQVIHGYNDGTNGDLQCADAISIVNGAVHVMRARLDGQSLYLRVNDRTEVSVGGITTHRTHGDLVQIGASFDDSEFITGTCHVWAFNQPLSTADRDDMYAYLEGVYGVTIP